MKQSVRAISKLHHTLQATMNLSSPHMNDVKIILDALVAQFTWNDLVQYYMHGRKDQFVVLPFHLIPRLTAHRSVELHKGFAYIPCFKLLDILSVIFSKLLNNGMRQSEKLLAETLLSGDKRICTLCNKMKV